MRYVLRCQLITDFLLRTKKPPLWRFLLWIDSACYLAKAGASLIWLVVVSLSLHPFKLGLQAGFAGLGL